MIFESKWKQFLLLENIEEVYQKIVKKNPERKQIWDRFKAGIEQKVRSPILAGQYLQWAFSQIANPQKYNEIVVDGNMSKEDMIMEAINLFEDNKSRISGSKSILDYDWSGVRTALGNIESSKREKKKQIKDTGADVLYESNSVSVIHIKTEKASCIYGAGTKWCTAATNSDNMFDSYNSRNYLVIIASKENPKNKFQISISEAHGSIEDAMDSEDSPIILKNLVEVFGIAEIKNVLKSIPFLKKDKDKIENFDAWYQRQETLALDIKPLLEWLNEISKNNEGIYFQLDDEDYLYDNNELDFWNVSGVHHRRNKGWLYIIDNITTTEDTSTETSEDLRRLAFYKESLMNINKNKTVLVTEVSNTNIRYKFRQYHDFLAFSSYPFFGDGMARIKVLISLEKIPKFSEAKEILESVIFEVWQPKTRHDIFGEMARRTTCCWPTWDVRKPQIEEAQRCLASSILNFPTENGRRYYKELLEYLESACESSSEEQYSWLWKDFSKYSLEQMFNFLEKLIKHVHAGNGSSPLKEELGSNRICIKIKNL